MYCRPLKRCIYTHASTYTYNKKREKTPGLAERDLTECDLAECDLSECDLAEKTPGLAERVLTECDLAECDLSKCDWLSPSLLSCLVFLLTLHPSICLSSLFLLIISLSVLQKGRNNFLGTTDDDKKHHPE